MIECYFFSYAPEEIILTKDSFYYLLKNSKRDDKPIIFTPFEDKENFGFFLGDRTYTHEEMKDAIPIITISEPVLIGKASFFSKWRNRIKFSLRILITGMTNRKLK